MATSSLMELKDISSAPVVSTFKIPKVDQPKTDVETHITISYKKPKTIADKLRTLTSTASYRELGEFTFDYYVDTEEIYNE